MKLGERLQALRRAAGLSQEQLAEKLNVSRQAISKWERDESLPDAEKIVALSDLFGVTTDQLLRGEAPAAAAPPGPSPSPDAPPQDAQPRRAGRAQLICGIVFSAVGAGGLLVIAVLSSMIKTHVPYTYQRDGMTWYSSRPGYSFSGLIERYRLQAIVAILAILLCVGLCLLAARLWSRWCRKNDGEQDSET